MMVSTMPCATHPSSLNTTGSASANIARSSPLCVPGAHSGLSAVELAMLQLYKATAARSKATTPDAASIDNIWTHKKTAPPEALAAPRVLLIRPKG
jgi:hypothetical protein